MARKSSEARVQLELTELSRALVVFPTQLGWFAMLGRQNTVEELCFGHASPEAAVAALDPELLAGAAERSWNPRLVHRLQAYAAGTPDAFLDVDVDPGSLTLFRRRVVDCCRRVPYGSTVTYAELAALAGSPSAARAVGNCMAQNRIPLIIPCHRVVACGRQWGGFSAPGGIRLKKKLLQMEAQAAAGNRGSEAG
jgi:methylated-DNA-[protein]-cysteine S-methyltransferase